MRRTDQRAVILDEQMTDRAVAQTLGGSSANQEQLRQLLRRNRPGLLKRLTSRSAAGFYTRPLH